MNSAVTPQRGATKSSRVVTRFTATDHTLVARAATAAGLPVAGFVRGASVDVATQWLGRPEVTVSPDSTLSDEDRRIMLAGQLALRRIGTLLNQQTRLAHRGQLDLAQLEPVVAELSATVQDLAARFGARA